MMRPPREDSVPWYKQFWPWFLISLPLSVVIAAIVTINIAIKTDDGLVSDDYYKEGLAIHKNADSSARARALGIAAVVQYAAETGVIRLTLDNPLADTSAALSLRVTHPTRPDRDRVVELRPSGNRQYTGRLDALGPARWKLELRPADRQWRVEGRLTLPQHPTTRLD